jgi:hypothetical protein
MPCDPSLHIAGKNWFSESYVRKDPGPEASTGHTEFHRRTGWRQQWPAAISLRHDRLMCSLTKNQAKFVIYSPLFSTNNNPADKSSYLSQHKKQEMF